MAVYGDDYSMAMLRSDLLGGLGGSIGGEAIDKMLGPVAKGLTERLGAKASQELIAIAKTAGSMEGGAWAQGQSGDLTIQNLIKTHLMGKAAGAITEATGSATGLTPKPGAHAVPTPEEHTAPQTTESTPQEGHPGATGSEEPRRTPVVAEQGGAAAGGREPTPAERLPSGAHDEEPGQTSSPAATEITTTDEGRPGVRSPGSEEEQTLVDWEPDVVHELPSGSAIMFDTPAEGRQLYSQSIREDSYREVAIYRNAQTGEVVVGQGSAGEVALDLQVLHESLPGPPGTWELEAHYHPINEQSGGVTPQAQRLPSSTNGDFSVLEWESQRAGNTPRTSRIDIITEGDRRNYTEFSYDPGAERPYKIDYPHPETGERTQREFKSREAYEEWYSNEFDGARADIEARPSTTAGGAAPAARSPGADEGGSGGNRDEGPRGTTAAETTEESELRAPNDDRTMDDFDPFAEEPTRIDANPAESATRSQLREEIRRLAQGEGITLPGPGGEIERSDRGVDSAMQTLRNPAATPEDQYAAIRVLAERVVAEYRAAHMSLEGEPGEPLRLTSDDLRAMCMAGRDISAEAMISLVGVSPHTVTIERVQAAHLGFKSQHAFTVVTLADGRKS